MCTNYRPTRESEWVRHRLGVDLPADYPDEIYPGQASPLVVKSHQSGRVACGLARFGLIPPWAKDTKISRHTYNARSETASQKPSFKTAWRQRQFGLVLVDHFYEPSYQTGRPVRWKIALESGEPFAIGCLWDRWNDPDTGDIIASFAMLTINADPHPVMNRFHKAQDEKRTPVVIPAHLHHDWLGADHDRATRLMALQTMPILTASAAPTGPKNPRLPDPA